MRHNIRFLLIVTMLLLVTGSGTFCAIIILGGKR